MHVCEYETKRRKTEDNNLKSEQEFNENNISDKKEEEQHGQVVTESNEANSRQQSEEEQNNFKSKKSGGNALTGNVKQLVTPTLEVHKSLKRGGSGDEHLSHNCDQCGRKFLKKSNLKLHKEKAVCLVDSAGILSTQELNSGKCDKCGYKPSQISDLRRHKLRDSCDELFSHNCGHCERQFLKKSKLKTHQKRAVCRVDSAGILSTQELSSGKCDKCGHKPSQISDLRRHKKKLLCKGLLQKNEQ